MSNVDVYVDTPDGPTLVGRLFLTRRRAAEAATFSYDASWLADDRSYAIDPQLPLTAGVFHSADRPLFGALADSAPDRWGVELAVRAERRRAARTRGTRRSLGEADLLLHVRDRLRQGALRLREPTTGEFLAPDSDGIPALVDLPRLLGAATNLERDQDSDEDLRLLLEAGSSLGGARPKANVLDSGRLSIAKFPRLVRDPWSVIVWEKIALDMARDGGIEVAAARLVDVVGRFVLLVERFDRTAGEQRIGYVSAMTMLEATDNDRRSYTEIAEVIETVSPRAGEDLAALWRRVAFSILISNTDDHLRNHGFLRDGRGWSLSPAFDLNPSPDATGLLSTAIDTPRDRSADLRLLMDVADYFRVADPRAVLRDLLVATDNWRDRARHHGVAGEVARLAPAFDHEQRALALRLVAR